MTQTGTTSAQVGIRFLNLLLSVLHLARLCVNAPVVSAACHSYSLRH